MLAHHMTHMPHNPFCQACITAKFRHVPRRRKHKERDDDSPTSFGQEVSADHVHAASEEMEGFTGDKDVLIIYDLGTRYGDAFPVRSKNADEA